MLDLVQVRSFVAVAGELHFGRAARRLNMTQPPLSRQIRLLEDHLRVQLFERSRQGVRLTPAGARFLTEARALLALAENAEAAMRRTEAEPEGEVRVGFYGAAAFRLLPKLMVEARARYPRIRLVLKELDGAGQLDAFAFGRLDLGILRPYAPPAGLSAELVMRERLVLAVPQDHPLAARRQARPSDLQGQPFVAYGPDAPYMHGLVRGLLAAERVEPVEVQGLAHAPAILSLVGVGLGVAIVPDHASHSGAEGVVFRPLTLRAPQHALTHLLAPAEIRRPVIGLVRALILSVGAGLETGTARP